MTSFCEKNFDCEKKNFSEIKSGWTNIELRKFFENSKKISEKDYFWARVNSFLGLTNETRFYHLKKFSLFTGISYYKRKMLDFFISKITCQSTHQKSISSMNSKFVKKMYFTRTFCRSTNHKIQLTRLLYRASNGCAR